MVNESQTSSVGLLLPDSQNHLPAGGSSSFHPESARKTQGGGSKWGRKGATAPPPNSLKGNEHQNWTGNKPMQER